MEVRRDKFGVRSGVRFGDVLAEARRRRGFGDYGTTGLQDDGTTGRRTTDVIRDGAIAPLEVRSSEWWQCFGGMALSNVRSPSSRSPVVP